jgi:hypothetical protein
MNSTREERPRRPLVAAFVYIGLGLLFLVMAFGRPAIANLRWHDIVRLLAVGFFLGMGLTLVVNHVFHRKG